MRGPKLTTELVVETARNLLFHVQ